MLSLGTPGWASTAILLAASIFMASGRTAVRDAGVRARLGLIASMFVGNLFLLNLNLPLSPAFADLVRSPDIYLATAILGISLVGAYAATLDMTTVWMSLLFGALR